VEERRIGEEDDAGEEGGGETGRGPDQVGAEAHGRHCNRSQKRKRDPEVPLRSRKSDFSYFFFPLALLAVFFAFAAGFFVAIQFTTFHA
jgi:hypothetical protein